MKRAWFGIGVACLVGAAVACNPFAPDQSVVLGVEKIDAPATSPVGSPLTVVLTVLVNGCQSFDHLEAMSVAAGASVFLPKPFTPPQVQMMLRMLASKAG